MRRAAYPESSGGEYAAVAARTGQRREKRLPAGYSAPTAAATHAPKPDAASEHLAHDGKEGDAPQAHG